MVQVEATIQIKWSWKNMIIMVSISPLNKMCDYKLHIQNVNLVYIWDYCYSDATSDVMSCK